VHIVNDVVDIIDGSMCCYIGLIRDLVVVVGVLVFDEYDLVFMSNCGEDIGGMSFILFRDKFE